MIMGALDSVVHDVVGREEWVFEKGAVRKDASS